MMSRWRQSSQCFDCLVVVGSILAPIVRSGVGRIAVGSVGVLLLLVVDWHEVLHVHGVLPLLVGPDADGRQAEEDGGDESQTNSDPGNDVGPGVDCVGLVFQFLKLKYLVENSGFLLWEVRPTLTSLQFILKSSDWESLEALIFSFSQCSTPCQSPIPPAWNKQAISIRMAEAVMLEGDVFQQPRMPAVKETNMKKNPTMKRAIIARIISGEKRKL